ncbi:MAG: DUF1080 domain-containing protein [Cyclobacteriaceae bacterium]
MKSSIYSLAILCIMVACSPKPKNGEKDGNTKVDKKENAWIILFDGTSMDQWQGYNNNGEMYPSWTIEEGAMKFTPGEVGGQNIVTKSEFTDFVLSLEWKISEGGNSGIFWGVFEDSTFNEAYQTGPEIQVLDNDRHPDAQANPKFHQAGALYDMVQPTADVCKPAGEWNKVQLKVNHKTNTGWVKLNGTKIVQFEPHGAEWDSLVANSKFATWEGFGKYKTGKIGLQDHGDIVWYRNIKIKEL